MGCLALLPWLAACERPVEAQWSGYVEGDFVYVAAPLGWFNTRLILGVVFFVLFTPAALLLAFKRALDPSKDMLRRAPHEGSYWVKREQQRPREAPGRRSVHQSSVYPTG